MLDLVVVDGRARGIVTRNLVTGKIESHRRRRRGAGHRRLRHRLLPVHQRLELQRHRDLPRLQARRLLRQPLLHADPPDLHPRDRRAPVEAHAHVGVAAQRRPRLGAQAGRRPPAAGRDPGGRARLLSGAEIPEVSATWCRATSPRAPPSRCATRAAASARAAAASTSTSPTPSASTRGEAYIREKYGNLFDMYAHITDENPYQAPMRIYPAVHYTMGGLWVDYDLMSNVPGLFVLGEANFSDHGANRLGASAYAGPGRRLFRRALHAGQLPGVERRRADGDESCGRQPGVQAGGGGGRATG